MKSMRLWIYRMIMLVIPETRCFGLKRMLLRWAGAQVADDVRICSSAKFLGDGNLFLGKDVWIGQGVSIMATGTATIRIDDYTGLAPEAMLFTGFHEIEPNGIRIHGKGTFQDIIIGKGCMIGARSVILPGVSIADMSLVAAGAIVSKSFTEHHSLIAGVPAVFKRSLLVRK